MQHVDQCTLVYMYTGLRKAKLATHNAHIIRLTTKQIDKITVSVFHTLLGEHPAVYRQSR